MSRLRVVLYILLAVFLLLLFTGGGLVWYIGFHDGPLRMNFDPARIAQAETRMWQAYYNGNGVDMALEMVVLLREQMGVSLMTAKEVVEPMARGAMEFQRTRENYREAVLDKLEASYRRLGEACKQDWDAKAVAEAELDWWVARRTPGENSPEQVGAKIAHLYALLYGKTNPAIEQAGYLRARAATLRDEGGKNADWPEVERILIDSYTELMKGIRQNAE